MSGTSIKSEEKGIIVPVVKFGDESCLRILALKSSMSSAWPMTMYMWWATNWSNWVMGFPGYWKIPVLVMMLVRVGEPS